MSQSAISKHIASLEHQLGFALFNRTSNAISLTEEGRLFLQGSAEIVDKFDKLITQCQTIKSSRKRKLRVMEMTHESSAFMRLCSYCNSYSKAEAVSVSFSAVSENGPLPDLLSSFFDVALVFRFNELIESFKNICEDGDFRYMPLFQDSATIWFHADSGIDSVINSQTATFQDFASIPIKTTIGPVYDFMKENIELVFEQSDQVPLFRYVGFSSVSDYFLSDFDDEVLFTLTGALQRSVIAGRADIKSRVLKNDCFKMTAFLVTKNNNVEGNEFLDFIQRNPFA